MIVFDDQGCAVCREHWLSGSRPRYLAIDVELHTRLFRCDICGSYWEELERYAVEVTESEVQHFPGEFRSVD
jgi:hypothetical protein